MRTDLARDPHVLGIVRLMSAHRPPNVRTPADAVHTASTTVRDPSMMCRVIGALHVVWSLFDEQSSDGKIAFYSPETVDELVQWQGFTKAMIQVGWLAYDEQVLEMHNFTIHNGQSAKRRMMDANRKREARMSCPPDVQATADSVRTASEKAVSREEKRREETLTLSTNPSSKSKAKVKGFVRPTLEDIKKEVAARGNKIDPEQFFAFYESKGWRVGNQSMKNWKAAIVTWEGRERDKHKGPGVPGVNGIELRRQAAERLKR